MLELRILGTVEIVLDGTSVEVGGVRPTRILVALSLAGGPLTVDQLADRSFADATRPEDPTSAIRTAVSRLRAALGEGAIITRPGGYELGECISDLYRFEELTHAARATKDAVAAASLLREALDLWRGEPFSGLGDLEWLQPEVLRLQEAHLLASESFYESWLRTGAATEFLPELEGLVAEHPLRDRFRRQLMLALFRAGRQAEALRSFQSYRLELTEAGLEPPRETAELEQRIAQSDQTLLEPDEHRPLRGYQIHQRLGQGAFSIVYRATQPSVGRDVAIKQIRSELANRPEFIRRFEAEAHMVARLEHPHIVPLIDYWREPGSAYLVMRLLRAGSLESSVMDGRWSVERTTRMLEQIGSALTAAHGAGVVHRDVKSANILLDDDGNSYLTDFGIALEASESSDPQAALSAGSPAYASPEQLRRETVGPPADVHGLAIAAYEALTGRLPFPDELNQAALLQRQMHDLIPLVRNTRSDVPAAVDDVLQVATAKLPQDRYPTSADFVEAFVAAANAPGHRDRSVRFSATTITGAERNPYKGLRAFDEADAADFSGRARLVDQLVEVLDAERLVAVVGPSGSGKSSVVRAGLLPELRHDPARESADWFVTTIVPGGHPFEELEAGLLKIASSHPVGLLDVLRDGERGIGRAIRHVLPEAGELLLVIDQFEEVFTLCTDEQERRQFLDSLASALTQERSRLRVVLTLRADFFDRPLRYESIGRLIRDATVPVLPLAADELERAIVDPAHSVGAEFEPGLVSELVADVSDQPGALPLLQYALTELYERRVSGLLLRDAYREIGGVTGALARKAEELFTEAGVGEQVATRQVFGRLVTLGEGKGDTRRRATRAEVASTPEAKAVVDRLGSARLLSFDRDGATREPTVEIAHEALISGWPRLGDWLDEDRDGMRILRHLHTAAAEWEVAARPASELYRGGRLEGVEQWVGESGVRLTEIESAFVTSSLTQQADEAASQLRTNRRLRRLLTGVAIVAAMALIAGTVAVQQQRRASDQADLATLRSAEAEASAIAADASRIDAEAETVRADANAEQADNAAALAEAGQLEAEQARASTARLAFESETGRLVATAESLAFTNPRAAMLLAATAFDRVESPETLGALQQALSLAGPLIGHIRSGTPYLNAEWLPDGRIVAVRPSGVEVFDPATSEVLATAEFVVGRPERGLGLSDVVLSAVSTDGTMLAVATPAPSVRIFDLSEGLVEIGDLAVELPVVSVSVSPDARRIVASDAADQVYGWTSGGEELFKRDVNDIEFVLDLVRPFIGDDLLLAAVFASIEVQTVVFADASQVTVSIGGVLQRMSYDGDLVGSGTLVIRRWPDGSPAIAAHARLAPLDSGGYEVIGIGHRIAITSGVFDQPLLTTPVLEGTGGANPFIVDAIHTETSFVAAMDDGSIRFFDAVSNAQTSVLDLGFGRSTAISISPAGDRFVISHDAGLAIVSVDQANPLAISIPRTPVQTVVSTDPGGGFVLLSPPAIPGPIDLWTVDEDGAKRSIDIARPDDEYAAIMPDNPIILIRPAAIGVTETELAIALPSFQVVGTIPDYPPFTSADQDLELDLIVYGTAFPTVGADVRQLSSGERVTRIGPESFLTTVRFGPSGERLLIATEVGDASMFSVADWERIEVPALNRSDIVIGHWSDDGSLVATVSTTGNITIRDGTSFEAVTMLIGADQRMRRGAEGTLYFSADNQYLLTNFDGPGRLWDVASGQQIGREFSTLNGTKSGANQGDGLHLVTLTESSVLVWNLDVATWRDTACRAAGSNLTADEWAQWGPRDQDRYPVCEQYAAP